jgi:tetratricopeptide (TPR) repeat protein
MRWNRAAVGCLAAAGIAALTYGLTLAPAVGAGDSGELILAAESLGLPHPPGYPLWVLLARLAAAVPVAALALRVNALSAALAAVGAGLFWLLARRAGLRVFPAAVATALFAGSSIVWRSAVEAEVYALSTAAFLALCLLALRARRAAGTERDEALYFFAAGLSALAHQTLVFPAAALGIWILGRHLRSNRALAAAGWALAGFSVALVIPVRASAGPPFAWTSETGLGALLDHLLRRDYGGLAQNPFRLDRVADEAAGMAAIVLGSVGWLGGILGAAGLMAPGRERAAARPIALAALTVPAALVALIGFTPDAEHLAQVAPFLTPVVAAVALCAGAGAGRITAFFPPRARWASVAVVAACAVATMAFRYAEADRSGFRLAERYGRDLLGDLPAGATLVLDGDNETFLAAYMTRHERFRADLTLVHRRGYLFGDPYGLHAMPRARWAAAARRGDLARLAGARSPVYYATPPVDLVDAGVRFVQEGVVYRALPPGADEALEGRDPWALPSAWPKSSDLLPGGPDRYDYVTRKMAVTYSDAAARWLWDRGRIEEALPWFEDAARVGHDFPGAHMNYATAAAAAGDPELALTELLRARDLAPHDPEPAARLAIFLAAAGRPREAALWFEKAFRVEPRRALAADAARAWSLAGDGPRARVWTERAKALARAETQATSAAGDEG